MKVAVIHNYYQQAGGEDEVFRAESDLLESHRHTVVRYSAHNQSVDSMGRAALAKATLWNRTVHRELRGLFRREGPDVAHFHNTFPLISPAAYYAAQAEGVAVVQTLHNFRLVCPNGLLFRNGQVCEECLGKFFAWPGIVHACYRKSPAASAVTAGMVTLHKGLGTWGQAVGVYIALSEFSRKKLIAGGLPAERIVVKPNFLSSDPGVGEHAGNYGLFVGRLAPEKGIGVLLQAWGQVGQHVRLKIIGGPLSREIAVSPHIDWLGAQPKQRVYAEMKAASFLVFPSECYENCPMGIIEAFATGLPVLASGLGSAAEMVTDHQTGLHFRAGDPMDLAAKVQWATTHPQDLAAMGLRARQEFERKYSKEGNYLRLMEIYSIATARPARRAAAGPR
jgi:glycosyltransferase involved in cell wall biosynthesis